MSLDSQIRHAAERPIPWNELRERRVLAELRRRRAEGDRAPGREARRGPGQRLPPRHRRLGGAAALLVFGAALGLVASRRPFAPPLSSELAAQLELGARPQPETPAHRSRMRLADGSQVQLAAGTHVDLLAQDAKLIRLEQHEGSAHYEIVPGLPRRFELLAAGVRVEVVGTAFDVELSAHRFKIDVAKGAVRVVAGDRTARLGPGDELQIALPVSAPSIARDDQDDEEGPEPGGAPGPEVGSTAAPSAQGRGPAAPPLADAPGTDTPPADLGELLARVDEARASGALPLAAKLLRQAVREHPKDPRLPSAWFTLARVEKQRGREAAAAEAFARAHRSAPRGPLGEDALAEAARAWQAAGQTDRAAEAARRYLDRYPRGIHRGPMAKITSP